MPLLFESQTVVNEVHNRIPHLRDISYPGSAPASVWAPALCTVANLVKEHNKTVENEDTSVFGGEVYDRGLENLTEMYLDDRAVLLLDEKGNPAYFGGMERKFSTQEEELFGVELVEFVNSITAPDFRNGKNGNGLGVGKAGTLLRLIKAYEKYDPEKLLVYFETESAPVLFIYESLNQFGGIDPPWNMKKIDFNDHPYISAITCQYNARGLDDKHDCSTVRRPRELFNTAHFQELRNSHTSPILKTHCTLVVSDGERASGFEDTCRSLHAQLGDRQPVYMDPQENLTKDHILRGYYFFDAVKSQLNGKHS